MALRREFLQTAGTVALATSMCAASPPLSAQVRDGVVAPHFKVTWVGGPTLVITFGNFTILTDPTLGATFAMGDPNDAVDHKTIRMHRRLTPVAGVDLKAVDLILLSHIHEDHFDQQAWADLDQTLPVILPIADAKAVGAKGFKMLDGLKWGETREFNAGARSVRITAMAARHSKNPVMAKALGTGNGYWIELRDGAWKRTMYWTGDTMPTDDVVNMVRSYGRPDLMVPHVGRVGTTGPFGQISMGAADVIALATEIRPKYLLPIHHSTFGFYLEPIEKLADRSLGEPYRLDLITAGSTLIYH